MPFVNYACWEKDGTSTFIRATAQTTRRDAFLAVHMPFNDLQVEKGPASAGSDEGFFESVHNAPGSLVATVEGDPGSGKSHLIQWMQYRWPESEQDFVVMIPRQDGTLFGTLELLRTRLGERYAEALKGLTGAAQLTPAGSAEALKHGLTLLCKSGFLANGVVAYAGEWLDTHQAELLLRATLYKSWEAPEKILRVLLGKSATVVNQPRDQQVAEFRPEDILELIGMVRGDPAARGTSLYRLLDGERHETAQALARSEGRPLTPADVPPHTREFLRALNDRLRLVIPPLLGMQPGDLKRKFLEVRRLLQRDGKRLVLLLEDITNLQGVDRELLEALWPTQDSDPDLCRLVAVVGFTPWYRQQFLQDNALDRFGLRVSLTPLQGMSSRNLLGDSVNRQRFAATYLDAIRHGAGALGSAPARRASRCEGCPYRADCHAAFGAVEVNWIGGPIGLYPFNMEALEHFWDRLGDREGKNLHTPRGLLVHVMEPVLNSVEFLEVGEFPSEFRTATLHPVALNQDAKDRAVRLWSDPATRDRALRVIQWWGDDWSGTIAQERAVYAAFGFPEPSRIPAIVPVVTPTPDTLPVPEAKAVAPPADVPSWRVHEQQLSEWSEKKDFRFSSRPFWEGLAFEVLREVTPEHRGLPRWLWDKVFTKNNIVLEGASSAAPSALAFVLPPTEDVVRGLLALSRLQPDRLSETGRQSLGVERNLLAATLFHEWLVTRATEHARTIEKGHLYPVGLHHRRLEHLAVRAAVTAGWLAGTSHPGASPLEQWVGAFAPAPSSQPRGRTPVWQALRDEVLRRQDAVRDSVRDSLATAPSRLLDPQAAWEALDGWNGGWTAVPRTGRAPIDNTFDGPLEVGKILGSKFSAAVDGELGAIRKHCSDIRDVVGDFAPHMFADNLHRTLDALHQLNQALVPEGLWFRWSGARDAFLAVPEARRDAVDDLVERVVAPGDTRPPPLGDDISTCVQADPEALAIVAQMAATGSSALQHAHAIAEARVTASVANTQPLRDFAAHIRTAVNEFRKKL